MCIQHSYPSKRSHVCLRQRVTKKKMFPRTITTKIYSLQNKIPQKKVKLFPLITRRSEFLCKTRITAYRQTSHDKTVFVQGFGGIYI